MATAAKTGNVLRFTTQRSATTLLLAAGCTLAAGCQTSERDKADAAHQQQYVGAFNYQPINPLTVWINSGPGHHDGIPPSAYRQAFLDAFGNDATRVAMAKLNAKGTLSYIPVIATAEGETYSMVIDYIKYMTISVPVRVYEVVTPEVEPSIAGKIVPRTDERYGFSQYYDAGTGIPARKRFITIEASLSAEADRKLLTSGQSAGNQRVSAQVTAQEHVREVFAGSMPLYIGVGLRVRADFKSAGGGVKVSGLPGLSAEASAGRVSGTLSVQTMGVGGSEVTPLMPIPSDLSVASIQAAIQAAASIKVKLYDPKTIVQPMIVGFESPVTEGDVMAELTSFVYGRDVRAALELSDIETVDGTKKVLWPKWQPVEGGAAGAGGAGGSGGAGGTGGAGGQGDEKKSGQPKDATKSEPAVKVTVPAGEPKPTGN